MMTKTQQAWAQVPFQVQRLFIKYAAKAREVVEASDDPSDWHFDTPEVGEIKIGKDQPTPPLAPLRKVTDAIQMLGGGPNPLTATLLGGGLGALLGYGGGKLLHRFAPEYFEKDIGSRLGLPVGLLAGAGIPALMLGGGMHRMYGPKGWLMRSPLQGGTSELPAGVEPPQWFKDRKTSAASTDNMYQDAIDRVGAVFNIKFEKDAFFMRAGAGGRHHVPDVQTDEWGRVVAPDPFMPAPTKALVAGLPAATSAATGSKWVSPTDIGRVAANAGLGWGMGKAIGMVAGPILRLTPKARTDIQRAGLFAGLFKSLGFL